MKFMTASETRVAWKSASVATKQALGILLPAIEEVLVGALHGIYTVRGSAGHLLLAGDAITVNALAYNYRPHRVPLRDIRAGEAFAYGKDYVCVGMRNGKLHAVCVDADTEYSVTFTNMDTLVLI